MQTEPFRKIELGGGVGRALEAFSRKRLQK
jgi:hypothetical protein